MALIDKETIRAEIERLVKNNDSLTEQPVEGLEEAADKYAERLTTEPYLQIVHKTDFIAGAEWGIRKEKERQKKMVENYTEGRES